MVIQSECLIFSEKVTMASFTNNVKNIEEVENPRISSVATWLPAFRERIFLYLLSNALHNSDFKESKTQWQWIKN